MKHQTEKNEYNFNGFPMQVVGRSETDYMSKPLSETGKTSFLVYKHNTYRIIQTENIAFFYFKFRSSIIVSFDGQEYSVHYSLEQIQQLLHERLFFRLNRQYLINFTAVEEVEHYFARKLLVKLTIPAREKLVVSKEKASGFLSWLENR